MRNEPDNAELERLLSERVSDWFTHDDVIGWVPDVHRIVDIVGPEILRWQRIAKQLHDALETLPLDDCAQSPQVPPCQICAALDAYRRHSDGSGGDDA